MSCALWNLGLRQSGLHHEGYDPFKAFGQQGEVCPLRFIKYMCIKRSRLFFAWRRPQFYSCTLWSACTIRTRPQWIRITWSRARQGLLESRACLVTNAARARGLEASRCACWRGSWVRSRSSSSSSSRQESVLSSTTKSCQTTAAWRAPRCSPPALPPRQSGTKGLDIHQSVLSRWRGIAYYRIR